MPKPARCKRALPGSSLHVNFDRKQVIDHDFQVVEIDGEKMSGALRDTLMVPPRSEMTVAFDADNVGVWPMHCHLLYHLDTGMFTVVKYEGADAKFWQPDAQAKAFGTSN